MRIKTFLICLAILTLRGWDRLIHPALWGEDGMVFFIQHLQHGWQIIFQPYEGYFHTLNRFLMYVFCQFPLTLLPFLITSFCFLLYAWVMSMIVDTSYRHLVKSDLNRAFIAFGLCIIPGGPEVIGSLCNTHRIWATYLLFIALRPYQEKLKLHHLFMTFIVTGTAGEVVAFLPMFLYRIYKRYQEDSKLKAIASELVLILIILGWTVANFAVRDTNTAPIHPDLFSISRATIAAFVFNFGLEPIIGWRLTGNLYHHAIALFWCVASISIFFMMKDAWKCRKTPRFQIYFAAFCLCAVQELAWIVRIGDLQVYKDFVPSMWWGNTRFTYILALASFLVWSVLFSSVSKKVGIAFVLLYFVLTNQLVIKSYGDTTFWPEMAKKIESSHKTGCPQQAEIMGYPLGWKSIFNSSIPAPVDCKEI